MHRALVEGTLGLGLGLPRATRLGGPGLDLDVRTGLGCLRALRCTLNNQLRTGTDKGNLTV